jgi:hypothetical protein
LQRTRQFISCAAQYSPAALRGNRRWQGFWHELTAAERMRGIITQLQ